MIRPTEISKRTDLNLDAFWRAQGSVIVRNMLRTAGHFALSDLGVRIVGEKGSGKLPLARLIHQASSRGSFSFVHIDCAELMHRHPEKALLGAEHSGQDGHETEPGLLETTDGGTIYLDAYPLLPGSIRDLLFKALDMKHFRRIGGTKDVRLNVRIINGITKSPGPAGAENDTETEMSMRISPVCINIPPLRERREDIKPLIYLFLEEYSQEMKKYVSGITSEALEVCRYYGWPGNIYELRNVIRHSALRCKGPALELDHLPEYIRHENRLKGMHHGKAVSTNL